MQCTRIVSVDQLRDEKYARILCYPRYDKVETLSRIRELKRLGVKALEFTGEKSAFNVRVLGKGYVGIVVLAHTKTSRIALKIRRVDSGRLGMEHEAEMLKKANSIGVGPRLVGVNEDFLLMEFVEGLLLPNWVANLRGRGVKKRIRRVLRQVLEQCWKLDEAGLDHGELSRAPKHIIVGAEDKVHIVDFETASIRRRVSNVTSVCQYLFLRSHVAKLLRRKYRGIDTDLLVSCLRDYKFKRTRQGLERILDVCGLNP